MQEVSRFQSLLDQGKTILQVAQECVVTEPHVRKTLGIANPDLINCDEYNRRDKHHHTLELLSDEIRALYEPKFITPDHTSEFIEALIRMSDAKQILELGMYSGFTTLHMLRAIVGKSGAQVVSVDARPAHDREFFSLFERQGWFKFIQGWTPDCLTSLRGRIFDLVFIDSDHTIEHTERELEALMPITQSGTILLFHDAPITPGTIYHWLLNKVSLGILKGTILPTAPQQDVTALFGPTRTDVRPNLGVFLRS